MPDAPADVTANPIKPECGSISCKFREAVTNIFSGAGAPTMATAQPNINQEAAEKFRQQTAEGKGVGADVPGMQKTAGIIQQRQKALMEAGM